MSRPNEGSIRPLGDGRWELQISLGTDPATGKRRRRSRVYNGTETGAARELNKWRRALLTKQTTTALTLAEAIDRHLADLAIRGRSPTTLEGYRDLAERIIKPALGSVPIGELGIEDLDRLYQAQTAAGRSASSVRHLNAVISGTLTTAAKKGWLGDQPTNVARYATKPAKPRGRIRAPKPGTVRQLWEAAAADETPERALMIRMLIETGVRRGEACGWRWSDLDGSSVAVARNVVAVRDAGIPASTNRTAAGRKPRLVAVKSLKNDGPARRIALSADLRLALELHRGRMEARAELFETELVADAYIFSDDPDGARPWYPPIVSEIVSRLKRNHRITERRLLHGLRHHAATEMLANGIDPAVGAERLGHASSKEFLDTYADARPARDQAAADLLGRMFTQNVDGGS